MADEDQPKTVYTEDDIIRFLANITEPSERAQKKAFFQGFGGLGAAMNRSHALREGVPQALSGEPSEIVDRIVEGVSEVATGITG